MNSTEYWINRYAEGGTSGAGSTGRLNLFKSGILNSLVLKFSVHSILDLGCGQGAILEYLECDQYTGFDPSIQTIKNLKSRFFDDTSKRFISELTGTDPHDMTISFDVIFHLIEDEVYRDYLNLLFALSTKYVLIYSSNSDRTDSEYATAPHVKHRKFHLDIPDNFKLVETYENLFPFNPNYPIDTSWSSFYLYKRCF